MILEAARKDYICDSCGEDIQKGDKYYHVPVVSGLFAKAHRHHPKCMEEDIATEQGEGHE